MFDCPLIVGYKGEIGSFILNCLLKSMPKATNILCIDVNETENEKIKRIKESREIFLCVPIQETVNWLKKYRKYIDKSKLIFEQCSLKSFLLTNKELNSFCNFISMHFLYKPSMTPKEDENRTLAFLQYQFDAKPLWRDYIEYLCDITNSHYTYFFDYDSHDKFVAIHQALTHRVILALSDIFSQDNDNVFDSIFGSKGKFTYMSAKVNDLAYRIRLGDKKLYKMIQKNKYMKDVMKIFLKKIKHFNF